jgi:hypothetical protein
MLKQSGVPTPSTEKSPNRGGGGALSPGAAGGRPATPPKPSTRIEDEVTGPTPPSPDEPEESTSPIDVATGLPVVPAAKRIANAVTPVPSAAKTLPPTPLAPKAPVAPRADGRPMLSQQATGQFHVDTLAPALPKKKKDEPKPAPKGGGAMAGLRKLAQTGMHLLPGNGSALKDIIRKTGMARLSQIQSLTGLHRLGPARFGFQVVIAGVMLLVGLGLVAHFAFGNDVPPDETLQFLYPYGFTGGVQPNGRAAPPASAVRFKFTGTVDCGSRVCDHFEVNGTDGVFRIEMTVAKRDDGTWTLVGGPPVR